MSDLDAMEAAFWQTVDEPTGSANEIKSFVRQAIEFMLEEGHDPLSDTRIENAVDHMVDTQPSWGTRMAKVWGALGHNFGDADSFDWSLQREMIRLFAAHPEAVQAVATGDQNFPRLGSAPLR